MISQIFVNGASRLAVLLGFLTHAGPAGRHAVRSKQEEESRHVDGSLPEAFQLWVRPTDACPPFAELIRNVWAPDKSVFFGGPDENEKRVQRRRDPNEAK
jgi:hypothetical protein